MNDVPIREYLDRILRDQEQLAERALNDAQEALRRIEILKERVDKSSGGTSALVSAAALIIAVVSIIAAFFR